LIADNASGTEGDGQRTGGYSGPTIATVETTSSESPRRRPRGRLLHVTIGDNPPGGQHKDYPTTDVSDNDLNSRRLETLQVGWFTVRSLHVFISN